MVRGIWRVAHTRSDPPFTHQTVKGEPKTCSGPSHRGGGRVRWAEAGLGEGEGAPHTHLLLPAQVKIT